MFLFQAEDGIRDLVRSRGLGGVYKRQIEGVRAVLRVLIVFALVTPFHSLFDQKASTWVFPVSYTHLTLPTSDLV